MSQTVAVSGITVAERLSAAIPGIVLESDEHAVTVPSDRVVEAALFLRDDDELDCKYLNTLLGVDWMEHYDVLYVLSSLAKNHCLTLRARSRHENPIVPSVSSVWLGAHLQEREVYDLMGIAFSDHPDLKRIFLWEGFPGHPLRKDFLALPGGYKPGLQRFPYEFPAGQRSYESLRSADPSAPDVPILPAAQPLNTGPQRAGLPSSGGQLGNLGGGVQGSRDEEASPPPSAQSFLSVVSEPTTGGQTPLADSADEAESSGGSGETPAQRTPREPSTARSSADAGEPPVRPPSSGLEVAPPDKRRGPNA